MPLELNLTMPAVLESVDTGQSSYDPELDDVRSVLRDICEGLESAGVRFSAGFGSQRDWPVTVQTDLVVTLEQLGAVLAALKRGIACRLDLYEQGVEKVLSFSPGDGVISIECRDLVPKPDSSPEASSLPAGMVVAKLERLGADFLRVSRICCPKLTVHPWFVAWAAELQHALDSDSGGP